MQDLLAYFETLSSVKYRQVNHVGPTALIESHLARAWETRNKNEISVSPLHAPGKSVDSPSASGFVFLADG